MGKHINHITENNNKSNNNNVDEDRKRRSSHHKDFLPSLPMKPSFSIKESSSYQQENYAKNGFEKSLMKFLDSGYNDQNGSSIIVPASYDTIELDNDFNVGTATTTSSTNHQEKNDNSNHKIIHPLLIDDNNNNSIIPQNTNKKELLPQYVCIPQQQGNLDNENNNSTKTIEIDNINANKRNDNNNKLNTSN